jgi:hypothetical protein
LLSVVKFIALQAAAQVVIFANDAPVDVAVSFNINRRFGVNAPVVSAGQDFFAEVIVYESEAASERAATVITPAVVESDFAPSNVPVPAVAVKVS